MATKHEIKSIQNKWVFFDRAKDVVQLCLAIAGLIGVIVGFFAYFIKDSRQTDKNFSEVTSKINDVEHSTNYLKLNVDQLSKSIEKERQDREADQLHLQDSINVRLTRIEDKIDRYIGDR